MSINTILGPFVREGDVFIFNFVNMSIYHDVYLRTRRLTCHNVYGPNGEADVICEIRLTHGLGAIIEAQTPEGAYHDLGTHSYRSIDFRLTEVDLRTNQITFQITIG
mgnify:CR=1 FL=1